MAQTKKSAPKMAASTSAKVTGFPSKKASNTNEKASHSSADNIIKMGTNTTRDWIESSTEELQKAQEKLFAVSRESAEKISRSVESASNAINDAIELCKENIEATLEVSNLAIDMSKTVSSDAVDFANELFADNVEASKELMSCRTVQDLFEIQSRCIKSNMDSLMNQTQKMCEMFFEFASEVAEPINESMSQTAERFTKTISKAA